MKIRTPNISFWLHQIRNDEVMLLNTDEQTAKRVLSQRGFSFFYSHHQPPPDMQRSAHCWGDSLNLLLTLNVPQMRDATVVALTTQDVPGSWTRPRRVKGTVGWCRGLKGEERSDGQEGRERGRAAVKKHFPAHPTGKSKEQRRGKERIITKIFSVGGGGL